VESKPKVSMNIEYKYSDLDIDICLRAYLQSNKADGCTYLLKGQYDFVHLEPKKCIVAILPSVANLGQVVGALPINFFFDKQCQIDLFNDKQYTYSDVFDEILPHLSRPEHAIARILFPYNDIERDHWLTGEVVIEMKEDHFQVDICAHDPLTHHAPINQENLEKLVKSIESRLKEFYPDHAVKYNITPSRYESRRQNDGTSCGPILVMELLLRVEGKALTYNHEIGAGRYRAQHLKKVEDPTSTAVTDKEKINFRKCNMIEKIPKFKAEAQSAEAAQPNDNNAFAPDNTTQNISKQVPANLFIQISPNLDKNTQQNLTTAKLIIKKSSYSFIPLSNGNQRSIAIPIKPYKIKSSKQHTSKDQNGEIGTVHTKACLFGSYGIKGVGTDGKIYYFMHEKIPRGVLINEIKFSEEFTLYERTALACFKYIALHIKSKKNIKHEVTHLLPEVEYYLYGISYLITTSFTKKAFDQYIRAVQSRIRKHKDEITKLYDAHNIKVLFKSPFDNLELDNKTPDEIINTLIKLFNREDITSAKDLVKINPDDLLSMVINIYADKNQKISGIRSTSKLFDEKGLNNKKTVDTFAEAEGRCNPFCPQNYKTPLLELMEAHQKNNPDQNIFMILSKFSELAGLVELLIDHNAKNQNVLAFYHKDQEQTLEIFEEYHSNLLRNLEAIIFEFPVIVETPENERLKRLFIQPDCSFITKLIIKTQMQLAGKVTPNYIQDANKNLQYYDNMWHAPPLMQKNQPAIRAAQMNRYFKYYNRQNDAQLVDYFMKWGLSQHGHMHKNKPANPPNSDQKTHISEINRSSIDGKMRKLIGASFMVIPYRTKILHNIPDKILFTIACRLARYTIFLKNLYPKKDNLHLVLNLSEQEPKQNDETLDTTDVKSQKAIPDSIWYIQDFGNIPKELRKTILKNLPLLETVHESKLELTTKFRSSIILTYLAIKSSDEFSIREALPTAKINHTDFFDHYIGTIILIRKLTDSEINIQDLFIRDLSRESIKLYCYMENTFHSKQKLIQQNLIDHMRNFARHLADCSIAMHFSANNLWNLLLSAFIILFHRIPSVKSLGSHKYGYDLLLMSQLPDSRPEKAQPGKIYIDEATRAYIVYDQNGLLKRGKLPDNIDLNNLKVNLDNAELKSQILEHTSQKGHTHKYPLYHIIADIDEAIQRSISRSKIGKLLKYPYFRELKRLSEAFNDPKNQIENFILNPSLRCKTFLSPKNNSNAKYILEPSNVLIGLRVQSNGHASLYVQEFDQLGNVDLYIFEAAFPNENKSNLEAKMKHEHCKSNDPKDIKTALNHLIKGRGTSGITIKSGEPEFIQNIDIEPDDFLKEIKWATIINQAEFVRMKKAYIQSRLEGLIALNKAGSTSMFAPKGTSNCFDYARRLIVATRNQQAIRSFPIPPLKNLAELPPLIKGECTAFKFN